MSEGLQFDDSKGYFDFAICLAIRKFCSSKNTNIWVSGQSYKHFTIVIWGIFKSGTTLE